MSRLMLRMRRYYQEVVHVLVCRRPKMGTVEGCCQAGAEVEAAGYRKAWRSYLTSCHRL